MMSEVYEERLEQAILPESMEEKTIDMMITGESAFVVPWAMYVDEDRFCWLLGKMVPMERPRGTSDTFIELQEDGWHVYINPGSHKWTLGGRGIVTSYESLLPVTQLHWGATDGRKY